MAVSLKSSASTELQRRVADAGALLAGGDAVGADRRFEQIVADFPESGEALHAFGIHQVNRGHPEAAAQALARAVLLEPRRAIYQRDLGELLRRLGKFEQSVACGLAATKLAPKDADAYYNLGLAYTALGDPARAIQCYRKAVRLEPRHGLAWNNLGSTLEVQHDSAGALKAYHAAIAIDARHAEAQNNLGALFVREGRLDDARRHFVAALDAMPHMVEAHYNLSSLKTYTRDDPHLANLLAVVPKRHTLITKTRIDFAFALAKALDDAGDADGAFTYYAEGNALQYAQTPYDELSASARFRATIETFTPQFFAEREAWQGYRDARTPIFIVGMPRSGTSLLEQILATHPQSFGAGEISDLDQLLQAALNPALPFQEAVEALTEADLKSLGRQYVDQLWRRSPGSVFITDKMPTNFFHIGLIRLALPGAKIIHATRDAMDTCWSCYTRNFDASMEFTYEQGALARYFERYATTMAHWRAALPEDVFFELSYERLVANIENETKRLLNFIGMPWDAACLAFYNNPRLVRTASVAQVRQPIYATSVGRWTRFARHLQPLWQVLKRYRTTEDLAPETLRLLEEAEHGPTGTSASPTATRSNAEKLQAEGFAYYRRELRHEALSCYRQALALEPRLETALNGEGFVLQELGALEEAVTSFEKCLAVAPGNAMARLNLAMAQLKLGRFDIGWENYESRWSGSSESLNGTLNRAISPLPQWNGENGTESQRLLVITEQGFGDTFQFSRYLTLAARRFADVGFACSAPTLRLMEWSFGERVRLATRMPAEAPDWDVQCPLMSLPRAFGTRLASIPGGVPYLKVPAPAALFWKQRLARNAPGRLRVGIAWAGRKAHQYDARRNIAFEALEPLFADPAIAWVSLQKWAPDDLRPNPPGHLSWCDWTDELVDFADTAALIQNLDLVLSVDSALVHLAGGLGKPVWMLNRFDGEWRWLHGRIDSPWYPSMRIFTQPDFGDWTSVIDSVKSQLDALPDSYREPASSVRRSTDKTHLTPIEPARIDIASSLQAAARHQSAGRLAQAEALLRRILNADAGHARALQLLGVVLYQTGKHSDAIGLIEAAIRADDSVALFHANLAEMYRQGGQIERAIAAGRRAVALDPAMASAQANLGLALYDFGSLDEAEKCQLRALEIEPRLVHALNALGSIERKRGKRDQAADWYRRALLVAPEHVESLSNLGAVLVEDKRNEEAIAPLERALVIQPQFAEGLCNLGLAHLGAGRIQVGQGLLERALQIKPRHPQAVAGLASALLESDQPEAAERLTRDAIDHGVVSADIHFQFAAALSRLAQPESAEIHFRRALELRADFADALVGLGQLRLESGALDDARTFFLEALAIDPDHVGASFNVVQSAKVRAGDTAPSKLAELLAGGRLSLSDRIATHYALGKAFDDLGEYPNAFREFRNGAALKRTLIQYDADWEDARTRRVGELLSAPFLGRLRGAGLASRQPIFILGMPRSGTTLTEQIISSHSTVFGAGELSALMDIVQTSATDGPTQRPYPENLAGLDHATIQRWAAQYLERLPPSASGMQHVTDKMPTNYYALGLIDLMLPNATIIHVMRDPVDTCLSCFTQLFGRRQFGTYDLAEVGRLYVSYAKLMEHWRHVLPGRFLEVRYEDIVADLEGEARRLIAYCKLDWEPGCLAFYKSPRRVRTASVTQVRQPLYASSVQRWRYYEAFLGPLFDALGEYAPDR